MKLLSALIVMLVATAAPVFAQEAATTGSFARCAALAEASANHQRDVAKDAEAAEAILKVANGYRFAAMLATNPVIEDSKTHVSELIAEQLPEFDAKLVGANDTASKIFPDDTAACAAIEPQAYALIKKFNDFQARKAK